MSNPNQIRERLKKIRLERLINQATLAKALFVKNTTISNWENGTRQIHLEALQHQSTPLLGGEATASFEYLADIMFPYYENYDFNYIYPPLE